MAARWFAGRQCSGNSRLANWKRSIKDLSRGNEVQSTRPTVNLPFGLTLWKVHVMMAGSQLCELTHYE